MAEVTLHSSKISCNHCVMTIKKAVSALEGVRSVEGDAETKQMTVKFAAPATQAQVEQAMIDAGYPVD